MINLFKSCILYIEINLAYFFVIFGTDKLILKEIISSKICAKLINIYARMLRYIKV